MRIGSYEIYNFKARRYFLRITITALFLFITLITCAADEVSSKTRLSFTGGFTLSNMLGNGIESRSEIFYYDYEENSFSRVGDNFKTGMKFGVDIIRNTNERFAVGIGVHYEQKGSTLPLNYLRYDDDDDDNTVPGYAEIDEKAKLTLSYLVIPLYLEIWYSRFFLKTGIYNAVLLKAKNFTEFKFEGDTLTWENESKKQYSGLEVGGILGVGYAHSISAKSRIKLGFNGNWAITSTKNPDLVGSNGGFRNQSLQLVISWEMLI